MKVYYLVLCCALFTTVASLSALDAIPDDSLALDAPRIECSKMLPCLNGGYCKDGYCFCHKGTRGAFCDVIEGCSSLLNPCPKNRKDVKCAYHVANQKVYCKCEDTNLSYDQMTQKCRRSCTVDDQCGFGACINDVCHCIPPTRGDMCEIVDCPSCAIKCQRQMYVHWWGGDMLFFFDGKTLLRFQRKEGTLNEAMDDCFSIPDGNVQCDSDLNLTWNGKDTVCIPWAQKLVWRFKLIK